MSVPLVAKCRANPSVVDYAWICSVAEYNRNPLVARYTEVPFETEYAQGFPVWQKTKGFPCGGILRDS
eukprot:1493315-Pyramimonas_sp.AAC.1